MLPKMPLPIRILLYLAFVIGLPLTFLQLADPFLSDFGTYVCYFLGAVGLFLGGPYLVRDIRFLWKRLIIWMGRYPLGRRLLEDYRFRCVMLMVPGLLCNIIFALINAVLGIQVESPWFGALSAYYILLALMRGNIVWKEWRIEHLKSKKKKRELERRVYRMNSVAILLLGLVLGGINFVLYENKGGKEYSGYLIYAVAAYTFFRVVMSLYNLVKVRKIQSPMLKILRRIGTVDSLMALLTLQTAMFAAFGTGMSTLMIQLANLITGSVVCLITMGIGVWGLTRKD